MKQTNHQRGNETSEHRELKPELRQFLHSLGFGMVLCEHQFCDVVAIHPSGASILAAEIERSSRNVLRNLSRDLSQGCDGVIVVCPDARTLSQVARAIANKASPEIQNRTGLLTITSLRLLRFRTPVR